MSNNNRPYVRVCEHKLNPFIPSDGYRIDVIVGDITLSITTQTASDDEYVKAYKPFEAKEIAERIAEKLGLEVRLKDE